MDDLLARISPSRPANLSWRSTTNARERYVFIETALDAACSWQVDSCFGSGFFARGGGRHGTHFPGTLRAGLEQPLQVAHMVLGVDELALAH